MNVNNEHGNARPSYTRNIVSSDIQTLNVQMDIYGNILWTDFDSAISLLEIN